LNMIMDKKILNSEKYEKVIDSYLIVSQLYSDITHNTFKFNHRKIHLTTLLVVLVK
jgi:hypothetical protein